MRKGIALTVLLVLTAAFIWAGGQSESAGTTTTTAAAVSGGRFNEAPMLAELVAAGELPPVEERLPLNPPITTPPEEIGKYGGVIKLVNTRPVEWHDFGSGRSTAIGWVKLDAATGEIYGELAESWDLSEDLTTWTIKFREGVRWSDGAPFTVDDVLFGMEDLFMNEEFNPNGYSFLQAGGEYAELTAIDDFTLEIKFAVPNPAFIGVLTGFRTWQEHMTEPKHYLQTWHPKYNEDAEKLAADEGFNSWADALTWHKKIYGGQNDLDLPRMDPWIPASLEPTRRVYTRNPYFLKTDPEGNQLPYFDGLDIAVIGDQNVLTLSVINGEVDYAAERLLLKDFPIMKEKEADPNYPFQVFTVPNGIASMPNIRFNMTYDLDPVIAKIIGDIRFRRAFSLAIDRETINEVLFFGLATPGQATPLSKGSALHIAGTENDDAEYDPQTAAALLAEMGLTRKNRDGLLLMENGQPLNIILESNVNEPTYFELMEQTLEAVGIGIDVKYYTDFNQLVARANLGNEIMVTVGDGGQVANSELVLWANGTSSFFGWVAGNWGKWFATSGREGVEPPQYVKDFAALVEEWQQQPFGSDGYNRIGREVYQTYHDWRWHVGVVGYTPQPVVLRNNIGNVVQPVPWTWARDTMSQFRETAYFKDR